MDIEDEVPQWSHDDFVDHFEWPVPRTKDGHIGPGAVFACGPLEGKRFGDCTAAERAQHKIWDIDERQRIVEAWEKREERDDD